MSDVLAAEETVLSSKTSFLSYVHVLIGLTCFFMPISTTLYSISLSILLLLVLCSPTERGHVLKLFKTSWGWAISCFLLFAGLSCCWGDALWHDKYVVLMKHSKLLYLPVLAVAFFDRKARLIGLQSILGGVGVTAMLSILSYFHCLPFLHIDPDYVFKNHIMMGFMGASGAYIAAYLAIESQGLLKWMYASVCLLLGFQLFWINAGRMGYILCLFLMGCLCWQHRKNRAVMAVVVSFMAMLVIFYAGSSVRQTRMQQLTTEWHEVVDLTSTEEKGSTAKETSVGYRVAFQRVAKDMLLSHPVRGYGVSGFGDYVVKHHFFTHWVGMLREPHNQYWLIGAELGLIGLCLFSWVLIALFVTIKRGTVLGWMGIGIFVAFCLNQLTDSMLFYSPGYFFILIMAMCLGEAHENSI